MNSTVVAMIAFFISLAGIGFELYNHNWAAAVWALWSTLLALLFFSVATILEDNG